MKGINKGGVVSQVTRDKLSDVHKGKVVSQVTRAKISEANIKNYRDKLY